MYPDMGSTVVMPDQLTLDVRGNNQQSVSIKTMGFFSSPTGVHICMCANANAGTSTYAHTGVFKNEGIIKLCDDLTIIFHKYIL